MSVQGFICDRCGAPFLEGRSVVRAVAGPLIRHFEQLDLCPDCQSALLRHLAEGRPAATAAGAAPR